MTQSLVEFQFSKLLSIHTLNLSNYHYILFRHYHHVGSVLLQATQKYLPWGQCVSGWVYVVNNHLLLQVPGCVVEYQSCQW